MFSIDLNRRIRSRMYGGVRGRRYSYLLLLDLLDGDMYGVADVFGDGGADGFVKKSV